ncbi:MAG: TIGR03663 family protein [Anaerolineales bacterium]|nr:TIGR03663 family protein [Anaerolineales bacterium]
MLNNETSKQSWLEYPLSSWFKLNWETIIFILLLILGVFSRFYDLETRVMSHDETSHVYFSWRLEQGMGYQHDPVTHGPLQFHLVALSYFLFGDNDFTARIPAAIFSVGTIAFMWFYRRYLGRVGALVAALLFLISPYFLYYGRYVRNEAFCGLFGVMTIWAVLRYLDTGLSRFLLFLTIITSMQFATKETAFIYTAQVLIFLGLFLVYRVSKQYWGNANDRNIFLIMLIVAFVLLGAGGVGHIAFPGENVSSVIDDATPGVPGEAINPGALSENNVLPLTLIILGVIAGLISLVFLIHGFTWKKLCQERSFDMIIVLLTMVMPMLAPFPVGLLGYNPIDYQNSQSILFDGIFGILLVVCAVVIGLLWNSRLWLTNAAAFYGIFVVLYTTFFTNGFGIVTGLFGSLGYWLEQQGVERGSQPWYFYIGLQIPVYEYLPFIGMITGFIMGIRRFLRSNKTPSQNETPELTTTSLLNDSSEATFFWLLSFWSITSIVAYTYAGEKMPWLTLHIALPLILFTAWAIGKIIENIDWHAFISQKGVLVILLLPVFFASGLGVIGSLFGVELPFQGKELEQLRATSTFLGSLIFLIVSGYGLTMLIKEWQPQQFSRVIGLFCFALLAILTARTAIMAAFINYDYATEYLVYAHSARGPKEALEQIEEISRRTTDGLALEIAYDNETTYPYWWYFRNYSHQNYYADTPSKELRNSPVILVGDANYGKIEPIVGQAFYQFDYIRLWWPNQDYFNLNWQRISEALSNPQTRVALYNIWLNRDYSLYATLTQKDMSLPNWDPAARMRLYIRKDIVAKMWNYGTSIAPEDVIADPYEGKQVTLTADKVIGSFGVESGQFQRPRDIAIAPDGSLFVADTENNRIQHLDAQGNVLHVWGSFADVSVGEAPGGTFNQPWGIAVSSDGMVYVADTWNHRIQMFTSEGEFITMWGTLGQSDSLYSFWGPRDVAVSEDGNVYVTDTGNKRIVVYDRDGLPITQFGESGLLPGQFDEPVGIAIGSAGQIYVADTWNQRIQEFLPDESGVYSSINQWDLSAWYGQSLDNKPYITVDSSDNVFAVDPESYRVLVFTGQGEFIQYWGDYGTGDDSFGLPASIVIDENGDAWVTDAGNSRIMHFDLSLPSQVDEISP